MSFSLYYRPVPKEIPPPRDLPVGLKYVIAPRWFDHDGSLRGRCVLDKRHVPYLEGIADANRGEASQGAAELVGAIGEHGAVELWIGDADD